MAPHNYEKTFKKLAMLTVLVYHKHALGISFRNS